MQEEGRNGARQEGEGHQSRQEEEVQILQGQGMLAPRRRGEGLAVQPAWARRPGE
jgi:hypothetical protein